MYARIAAAAIFGLFLVSPVRGAVTVSIGSNDGTPFNTDSIQPFAANGELIDGISVTVEFSNGDTDTQTWVGGPLGSGMGGVSVPLWSLTQSGDTFGFQWVLTNALNNRFLITGVTIDGVPGKTVFDLKNSGELTSGQSTDASPVGVGSVGSATGWTFDVVNGGIFDDFDLTATYSNKVSVGANSAVGDLWTTLDIQFETGFGLDPGVALFFIADTDITSNLDVNGPVPEPSSLALFTGLALLAGGWRMRRRGCS